jgi:hypothetical protein
MFFRQLWYIIVIPIPKSKELKMRKPEIICLMVVRQIHVILPNAHGILPILFYWQTGALDPTDIKGIWCVVGHVEDQGKWGLVDCSGPLAHAVFAEVD